METSGRIRFARYRWLITCFGSMIACAPAFLRRFLWSATLNYDGAISLVIRYSILSAEAKVVGENVFIGRNVSLKNCKDASFGSDVSIHEMCYIDAKGGLQIGSSVSVAHHTSILTFNHTWNEAKLPIKYNPLELKPVVIEDDVWVGCGVRIMPGVTIGQRSVIAAGAVVTKDVPKGTLVAGVPARVIRTIET